MMRRFFLIEWAIDVFFVVVDVCVGVVVVVDVFGVSKF